jgi:uncharacterized protein YggE
MKRSNLIKQSSMVLLAATMTVLSGCNNDTTSSCISGSTNSVNYSEMSLEGSAKKTLKADRAIVYLGVSEQKPTVAEVKESVEGRIPGFFASLEQLGIDKNKIIAERLNVTPKYRYDNGESIFVGYVGSIDIEITLDDFTLIKDIYDLAVKFDINHFQNINYTLKDVAKEKESLRTMAIEDAKKQAKSIAKDFGVKLEGIKSISYNTPYYNDGARVMLNSAKKSNSVDIYTPKDITLEDRISVIFKFSSTEVE